MQVTWDGASNIIPSKPIIGTLSYEELVDLVHAAHIQGLITYISAGMEIEQVRQRTPLCASVQDGALGRGVDFVRECQGPVW